MTTYKIDPVIKTVPAKKLIGIHRTMTLSNDTTFELWRSLMPRRKEISNTLNPDLISMQLFGKPLIEGLFTSDTPFEKWAAIEVSDLNIIPVGMDSCIVPSGLYACFPYKGAANEAQSTIQYIFEEWLPASGYQLDNRPHITVMGEKYKGNDPDSEEEFQIPVIRK
ncbi:MAG: GyrI-like domain-containing protein [Bacteroidota bacterium]|nr:GyrI-like domain-containing protein [Bacteroidota bacterium]